MVSRYLHMCSGVFQHEVDIADTTSYYHSRGCMYVSHTIMAITIYCRQSGAVVVDQVKEQLVVTIFRLVVKIRLFVETTTWGIVFFGTF